MSNIKLIVTDVDDTLLKRHTHQLSEGNLRAIEQLHKNGIHVAIASGRPAAMARDVLKSCELSGLQVIDGGATLYDFTTDAIVWQQWLSVERLMSITEIVLPFTDIIDVFPEMKMVSISEFSLNDIVESAPYVFAQIDENSYDQVTQRLATLPNLSCSIIAKDDSLLKIQICDEQATKQHGVEQLQRELGITRAETLAIGDQSNDIALFETADTTVAMGNAIDALKSAATYTTDTVENDGWAKAMQHFGLV